MRITAHASLKATEDVDRVRQAVTAFLPGADVAVGEKAVEAVSDDPSALRQRIWELRIIDAVRRRLMATVEGAEASLRLNKQAAFLGRVSPAVGTHALGELLLHFRVEEGDAWPDAEAFVWWLCPETKDGEIVA